MSNEEIIEELRTYPSPDRIDELCRNLEVNLALERDWHRGGAREALKQHRLLEKEIESLGDDVARLRARLRDRRRGSC